MSTPASALNPFLPSTPAPPTTASAPLSAASLFPLFANRAAYAAANGGVQPPQFDPTRHIQNWEDRSPTRPTSYNIIQVNSFDATKPTAPPASIVAMPAPANPTANMAGPYIWPSWSNPIETPATQTELSGSVNGTLLCDQVDAEMVAKVYATSSGTALAAPVQDPVSLGYSWNGETRRQWLVAGLNAAAALAMMTVKNYDSSGNYTGGGYGAPGLLTANGQNWAWSLTPDPGLSATGVPLPTPCVASLWAGFSFGNGPFGAVEIINSGVVSPTQPANSTGLTAAQAAALARIPAIDSNIQEIMSQRMGLIPE